MFSLQNVCWTFSNLYISPWAGIVFPFMVFTVLENALNLCIFQFPLKTPGRIFWKSVSSKTKSVEKTMICFVKFHSENMKMTWSIRLFIFCMIYNFSQCDGFTASKKYLSNSVVLSILLLLCNHGNLTLKLHQEKWLPCSKGKTTRRRLVLSSIQEC